MKVTTNYGLDGKVIVNFGTKDLPICTGTTALPSNEVTAAGKERK